MSQTLDRLLAQVNQAINNKQPLNICGAGTKQFLGRAANGTAISTLEHSGITSYQATELVMTAKAGTPVAEIEAALAEQGQMLPCELPNFAGKATIGGALAANLAGPGRPWYGSLRDLTLGCQLINGRGELLNFGGQVMKNVAGYDISRFQAGALGTLGLITELSFKVLPKPAASLTLVQQMDANSAITTMNRLAATAKPLTGACWLDDRLYLRLSGAEQAVESTAKQWGGEQLTHANAFWRALTEQQLAFFQGEQPLWRFSVNAASPAPGDSNYLIDWAGNQRWLKGEQAMAQLEVLAEQQGGEVSLYRGGDRDGEVFHRKSTALQGLHQRLKQAVDPDQLFNPGRLYSWL